MNRGPPTCRYGAARDGVTVNPPGCCPSPGAPNPGLGDRPYWLGLLVALAVVWISVTVVGVLRQRAR